MVPGLQNPGSVVGTQGLGRSVACGIFPNQGSKSLSPALAGGFLSTLPPGKAPLWTLIKSSWGSRLGRKAYCGPVTRHACLWPHYSIWTFQSWIYNQGKLEIKNCKDKMYFNPVSSNVNWWKKPWPSRRGLLLTRDTAAAHRTELFSLRYWYWFLLQALSFFKCSFIVVIAQHAICPLNKRLRVQSSTVTAAPQNSFILHHWDFRLTD